MEVKVTHRYCKGTAKFAKGHGKEVSRIVRSGPQKPNEK